MRFFWPIKLNPSPNAATYIGRVIHWVGCAVALAACLYGLYAVGSSFYQLVIGRKPTGATLYFAMGLVSLWAGTGIYAVSRALRQILSRE